MSKIKNFQGAQTPLILPSTPPIPPQKQKPERAPIVFGTDFQTKVLQKVLYYLHKYELLIHGINLPCLCQLSITYNGMHSKSSLGIRTPFRPALAALTAPIQSLRFLCTQLPSTPGWEHFIRTSKTVPFYSPSNSVLQSVLARLCTVCVILAPSKHHESRLHGAGRAPCIRGTYTDPVLVQYNLYWLGILDSFRCSSSAFFSIP